ncbi:hypothetical protein [Candidatus Pantoea multigeneris]|uniref:Uncharacterized protein n=1 Tax=Candidatus Pantoea multigeneris TaxID=2608357 RepID=A0ABX0RFB0_9GAMM|nr:hypothetical protein [Pantoea multigeneris]NIF24045.1 hypothetical protein [Pantoea multigeneris]
MNTHNVNTAASESTKTWVNGQEKQSAAGGETASALLNAMVELCKIEGELMALAAFYRLNNIALSDIGWDDEDVYALAEKFWHIAYATKGIATPALLGLQHEITLLGVAISFNDWSFADLAVVDERSRCEGCWERHAECVCELNEASA